MDHSQTTSKAAETEKTATELFLGSILSLPAESSKSFFRFVDKNPLFSDNDPQSILKSIQNLRKSQCHFVEHHKGNYDHRSACLGIPCFLETDD